MAARCGSRGRDAALDHFEQYIEVQISGVLLCFPRRTAESGMSRTLDARRHEALRAFLVERRKSAGLRQVDLANGWAAPSPMSAT
jgi:hypothetical protein